MHEEGDAAHGAASTFSIITIQGLASRCPLVPSGPGDACDGLREAAASARRQCTVAVKVIDIFGNDTMTLVPVNVA
jgi:hypothetical protein